MNLRSKLTKSTSELHHATSLLDRNFSLNVSLKKSNIIKYKPILFDQILF